MPVLWAFFHRTNPEETPERVPLELAQAGTSPLRKMRTPGRLRTGQSDPAITPRDRLINPTHAVLYRVTS